ncbi:MAG: hypothetical protein M0017_01690, partial [Desulfobacteraceae bacterium]|nr:hypothetical protein [Desulfobacteraceae bacterium]
MTKKRLSVSTKPSRKELPPRREKELEFPEEIEREEAASGRPEGLALGKAAAASGKSGRKEVLPWEEPWVRPDVRKMLPVYFPEPVYLKLKFVSENTRVSMSELIR